MGKIIKFNSFRNANIQEEALEGFLKSIEEKEANPEFQAVVAYRKDLLVQEMIKRCYGEDIINAYFDYVDMMDTDYTGEDEPDYLSLNTCLKIFDIKIEDISDGFSYVLDMVDFIEQIHNEADLADYFNQNKSSIEKGHMCSREEWEHCYPNYYFTKHGLLALKE